MIKLRLFPCSTTCAWDMRSSGTKGAGTDAMGRELLPLPPPIMTPGGPMRPPLPLPPPLLPPRIAELLRMILARDRDIVLLPLPLLPLPFGAEFEFPTWFLLVLQQEIEILLLLRNHLSHCFTYFLLGSFLLKSNLSGSTVNATLHILLSSVRRAICVGPTTRRFITTFRALKAGGVINPYLFILSATSLSLKR